MKIKFEGCKYLDYSDNYIDCKRQLLGTGELFWMRPDHGNGDPRMVQFCKKRGRLNNPQACLSSGKCSDYLKIEHSVDVPAKEINT